MVPASRATICSVITSPDPKVSASENSETSEMKIIIVNFMLIEFKSLVRVFVI